jgi:hypothetical protein
MQQTGFLLRSATPDMHSLPNRKPPSSIACQSATCARRWREQQEGARKEQGRSKEGRRKERARKEQGRSKEGARKEQGRSKGRSTCQVMSFPKDLETTSSCSWTAVPIALSRSVSAPTKSASASAQAHHKSFHLQNRERHPMTLACTG